MCKDIINIPETSVVKQWAEEILNTEENEQLGIIEELFATDFELVEPVQREVAKHNASAATLFNL